MLKCPSSGLGVLRTMGDVMVTPVLVEAENTWKMVSLDLLASLQSHHQAMVFWHCVGFPLWAPSWSWSPQVNAWWNLPRWDSRS